MIEFFTELLSKSQDAARQLKELNMPLLLEREIEDIAKSIPVQKYAENAVESVFERQFQLASQIQRKK